MCPHCGHVDGTCYQSTAFWTSGWDLEKKDLHHHLHSSIDNISSPCFRCSTVRQQKWKVWQWDEVQTIFIAAVWLNVSWWLINSSLKCFFSIDAFCLLQRTQHFSYHLLHKTYERFWDSGSSLNSQNVFFVRPEKLIKASVSSLYINAATQAVCNHMQDLTANLNQPVAFLTLSCHVTF